MSRSLPRAAAFLSLLALPLLAGSVAGSGTALAQDGDGQVRIELHHARSFRPPTITLWGLDAVN